jgi:hypothetical protein
MHNCVHCNRSFFNKGGLATHQPYCKENPNKKTRTRSPNSGAKKGHVPWNKGKTGVQRAWNKGIKNSTSGKASTIEKEAARREKISAKMKSHGGYRIGSGRGKKGWYKGFFCDSSWELAYVIFCLDHDIKIRRNTKKLKYVFNGEEKSYIPDFIVDGELVEIKGFKTDQWEAKLQHNPDVTALYKEEMKPILNYVESVYGKEFTKMYE